MSSHNLEHHKSVYFKVLLALFVFTVITVGATYFDFGSVAIAIIVGLSIAFVKGFLVISFFLLLISGFSRITRIIETLRFGLGDRR